MNDLAISLMIIGGVMALAVIWACVEDNVKALWALRHSKTKPLPAVNAVSWPCDVTPVFESWVGREIQRSATPPPLHIIEAEKVAEYAWYTWQPERVEEDVDD